MAATPMIFLAFDGDGIGRQAGSARLRNDVAEIRRVSQAIDRGNQLFSGLALSTGGSVVEVGGDEGLVELPAEALDQLEPLRQQYADLVGATVSAGVGKSPSEASQALLAAKLRGKDRTVFFAPEVAQEIKRLQDKTEEEKLKDEYLCKADSEGSADKSSQRGATAPARQSGEHSEGEVAQAALQDQAAVSRPLTDALSPQAAALAGFHAAADAQGQQDRAAAVRRSTDVQALKQRVASALQDLKTQLPVLQQIRQSAPDTYRAVTALAQGVVELARGLQDQDQQLAKAERPKVWREATGGFGTGISIPGALHPGRQSYDDQYRAAVAARYANGDPGGMELRDLDLASVGGGNSRGVHNPSRYSLYHRMFAAGDRVPPVVAVQTPSGYRLLDGTHRAEAARAAGVSKLPAYVVKKSFGEGAMADVQPHRPMLAQDTDLMREAMREVEFDASSKAPIQDVDVMAKDGLNPEKPHRKLNLPVGTLHGGELKVQHAPEPGKKGKTSWKGVRAGLVAGQDPGGVGGGGANTHAVSSREPNSP